MTDVKDDLDACPKCGSPLGPEQETPTGKKLRRCTAGSWNAQTHKNEGCDYVLWMLVEPKELDEKCPKCGGKLLLQVTRFGKKMKKCSNGGWDSATKTATGCDFVEWINGTSEPLAEDCPKCGSQLVLYTTAAGKKMKKCSTSGWDKEAKKATGCDYVEWLKKGDAVDSSAGEEFLPPEPAA